MSLSVAAARAEALFCCPLSTSDALTPERVRDEVARMVKDRGTRWCAHQMAQEFGDHPDTAPARMAWAAKTVAASWARAA